MGYKIDRAESFVHNNIVAAVRGVMLSYSYKWTKFRFQSSWYPY